mmetsp:Transcript_21527/g.55911  ORF Transcript_21527/g.55911 Transcript_21527/m.55911 type:complete len:175 (+) Transcript_21527:263-787(+)
MKATTTKKAAVPADDAETLLEVVEMQRKQIQALTVENTKLKTRVVRAEMAAQTAESRLFDALQTNPDVQKKFTKEQRTSVSNTIMLKKRVRQLESEKFAKAAELDRARTDAKLVRLLQLETEAKVYYTEAKKLQGKGATGGGGQAMSDTNKQQTGGATTKAVNQVRTIRSFSFA